MTLSFVKEELHERMIESFMLIANETVAEHFYTTEAAVHLPIHEYPKAEKVRQKFIDMLLALGSKLRNG